MPTSPPPKLQPYSPYHIPVTRTFKSHENSSPSQPPENSSLKSRTESIFEQVKPTKEEVSKVPTALSYPNQKPSVAEEVSWKRAPNQLSFPDSPLSPNALASPVRRPDSAPPQMVGISNKFFLLDDQAELKPTKVVRHSYFGPKPAPKDVKDGPSIHHHYIPLPLANFNKPTRRNTISENRVNTSPHPKSRRATEYVQLGAGGFSNTWSPSHKTVTEPSPITEQ